MNIFVNIDVFIHLYIFRLLCNARIQKKERETKAPAKRRLLFEPKKTRFKIYNMAYNKSRRFYYLRKNRH